MAGPFFGGGNTVGQEPWELRGATESRIQSLQTDTQTLTDRVDDAGAGLLGIVQVTANSATTETAELTVLTLSGVVIPAGRQIEIVADLIVQASVGGVRCNTRMRQTAPTSAQIQLRNPIAAAATDNLAIRMGRVLTNPAAGTYTFTVTIARGLGTTGNTVLMAAGSDFPAYLAAHDIGAA